MLKTNSPVKIMNEKIKKTNDFTDLLSEIEKLVEVNGYSS